MSTDMEDENAVSPCQEKSKTVQKKDHQQQDINDMFLDDDPNDVTEIRNIPYINIASPQKDFEKWKYPSFEREEGELTPDLHLEHSGKDGHKRATSKKARIKESNAEFFAKVNRCFRHVEKEFSNMHVSRGSKKLIEDLRNTLCVVERMKRKLTFLINSANSSSGNDKNFTNSNNKELVKSSSPNSKITSEKEYRNNDDDQKLKDFISYQSNKYQGKLKDNYLHNKSQSSLTLSSANIHSKREMVKAKMDNLRRTFATVTHSDSKMERQRIQSLFKRQMNLITQQIIQQSDQSKHQNSKSGNSSKASSSKSASHKHQQSRPSLENFKTLEEMENFLDLLKEKKGQKITPEDIIQHHRKKQVLKFTTKKGDPAPQVRALSVLLSGDAEDGNKIPTQVINSENSLLQTYTQDGKEQNGKHIQVQEKRKPEKEVIRNQKDLHSDYTVDKPSESYNLNAKVSSKSNISKQQSAGEVKDSKNISKKGEIDTNLKKQCVGEIQFRRDRNGSALKEVIDSSMVKRNSREIKCRESSFHSKSSDSEKDSSREIFPENSIKRISKKHSVPKSSESDSDSRKHRILKKRKRNESDGDSRRKLSSADLKKEIVSEKKSRTRYRSDDEEEGAVIDGVDEKLPEELLSKKLFIVGDENLALLDKHFCVKVKGNQIYLKKVGKVRKERYRDGREQRKNSPEFPKLLEEEELTPEKSSYERKDREIPIAIEEDNGPSLKEMEDFCNSCEQRKFQYRNNMIHLQNRINKAAR
ncbi:uncharacterized protein CEXT_480091 [Caerostris extrusa]|uniref:Uncharacterized protein n=1 Tax=Caerostris extrusa TaxID=172846 RepID=A0AAV4UBX9_CAEEX|nr:uncharacterized protein CEXT_480091 [Caerostris extrusa]